MEYLMGYIIALIPITKRVFAILLPITFPMAISGEFLSIALTETVNSGIEVPNPAIIDPTKTLERFNFFEIDIDEFIKNSPPRYNNRSPKNSDNKGVIYNFIN
jgi:hypothetical protein